VADQPDSAVIFDCDGVLLELLRNEEEMFFSALSAFVPTDELSRNWNSYTIRNDDDIISEVLGRFGMSESLKPKVIKHYLSALASALEKRHITSTAIPGTEKLLQQLKGKHRTGLATANFIEAARLRLEQAGLWPFVAHHAIGADGGGHKHQLLARLLETIPLPKNRIVYVGDNVVDVDAGLMNGVHLIGFSVSAERRDQLRAAGARHVAASHHEAAALIGQFLAS
jgi:phosphoglycolate phosphatase-like HAD superfamily hydrolase